MNYRIIPSTSFLKEAKRLAKKYPSFKNDLEILQKELTLNPNSGVEIGVSLRKVSTAGKVWQAIVIPDKAKLEIIVNLSNGKKITQPLAEMTLKSGGQYSINARLLQDDMTVSASGEIENWTDEGEIGFEGEGTTEEIPVEFTEYDGYFVYDGVEYKTVKLADGNTWMAENLRFIPRGRTVSSDPAEDAGIW